ncbi:AMP-binding protein [Yinghuangia soli]|uniref:AMP-binding protein n=1 Tax=Yinghuangia soli TaxID=2908204 RepID=A0AA41PXY7_9ACTN|nr:AMP-binding protein [Yinghuangia soli]MCF2527933.1 AMP-binding protein [Yinghuangia soli]
MSGTEPSAIEVAGRSLSREDLGAAAAAIADGIAGAPAVAVRATASLETVAAVLAGLTCGVPVVPVPPDAGPRERGHILSDSGATLLLDPDPAGGAALWDDVDLDIRPVDLGARASSPHPVPDPASPALILYTSGTTGPPKGVLVSHRAIAADIDALADAWDWTPDDVLVHGLPLFHVHGLVLGVLGALRVGSGLVHTGRPTPAGYAEAAGRGGSLFFGVPTVWSRIAEDAPAASALASARLLVSGSAPLPVPVFEQLAARTGHRPVERYGMTETLITVSTRASGDKAPGTVGTPIAGVSTRLVGEAGELLPHDGATVGELQVTGPTLSDGYLGLPEANAEAFTADGWFRTGDVATIAPDGGHRIVGRASTDLIKSGGYRVGAGEVEGALLAHPGVREAAVVGAPHDDLGQEIVAYVVADPGVDTAALGDFVARTLSVHKRPRRVVLMAELPRNAMGKVQKKQLG